MKKSYEKPTIFFDSFALSDRVSSGCEGIANIGESNCSVYIPELGESIFNIEMICEVSPPGGNETICFHAPYEWNNVYSS